MARILKSLILWIYSIFAKKTNALFVFQNNDDYEELEKLNVLLEQRVDLSTAIDDLLNDFATGEKYVKVYKQMKMYNDEDTNPMLYKKK